MNAGVAPIQSRLCSTPCQTPARIKPPASLSLSRFLTGVRGQPFTQFIAAFSAEANQGGICIKGSAICMLLRVGLHGGSGTARQPGDAGGLWVTKEVKGGEWSHDS